MAFRGSGLIIHLTLAGVHRDHAIDHLFYDRLDNPILTFHNVPLTSDVYRACGFHSQVRLFGDVVLSPCVCLQFCRYL